MLLTPPLDSDPFTKSEPYQGYNAVPQLILARYWLQGHDRPLPFKFARSLSEVFFSTRLLAVLVLVALP